jgi:hypothetical protein
LAAASIRVVAEPVVVEKVRRIHRAALVDGDTLLDRASQAHELLGPVADAGEHVEHLAVRVAERDEREVGLQEEAGALDHELGDLGNVAKAAQLSQRVVQDRIVAVVRSRRPAGRPSRKAPDGHCLQTLAS